ncbi:hypothetical protein F1880_009736 [Penicillium rolfsii]|nr:hypothetical protein F1880_009736 [Penicillium rolfsii]
MSSFIDGHYEHDSLHIPDSDHRIPSSRTPEKGFSTSSVLVPVPSDEVSPAVWGIGWWCPSLMVGFVTCGAMLSVGHHLYYQSLDNTRVYSVDQQTWAIRIGTGFAFLNKTFLVASVGIAAAQEIWATLRRKSVKLRGIDGMFAVLNNPLAFFIPDLWLYAKTLTLLAIISWLIPLSAIITPATLSVHLLTTTNTTQVRVPTVNFTDSFWASWMNFEGPGYIDSPSTEISRLFTVTSSSVEVVPASAPFPNSSYSLRFYGPSYQCQRLSEAILDMKGLTFPDILGKNHYTLQQVWNQTFANITNVTNPEIIYSGTVPSLLNNTFFLYATGSNPLWNTNTTQPTELVCQLWNTSYTVHQTFTNGVRTLTPISTTPLTPANWSSMAGKSVLLPGHQDTSANGGYYVIHQLFSGLIKHNIVIGSTGSVLDASPSSVLATSPLSVTQTGLWSCPEIWNSSDYLGLSLSRSNPTVLCRNKTLARALEDLSHNFTYSLLSLNAANTTVPVRVSSPQNFYNYDSRNLLLAYAIALGVSVGCVIVGLLALFENGVSQSTAFSSVLVTTRNPELDQLAVGHCLGRDPIGKEIGEARLQFGEMVGVGAGGREYRHAAFGMKWSVTALSKGRKYY